MYSIPRVIMFSSMIVLVVLQSCKQKEAKQQTTETETIQPAVEAEIIEKGSITSSVQMPGELLAWQQVDIYAKINSFVKNLYADVGSQVKKGQLLATMEAPEINSQLSASNAKLKSYEAIYTASKANYDRLLETSKTPGTISPNDLDIAAARQKSDYAQYQAAKSAYDEVINNRDYLQIRAPFSGVISARNVSQGAYVGPSGKGSELPMFTLQTQQKLRLVVSVPELYTSYLKPGNEVSFTVESLPNQVFKAEVNRLAGAIDQRLRSERIEMDVINDDRKLMPGMVAEIQISIPASDSAFLVSKSAIINSTDGLAVIQVSHGAANWITVKTGRESEDKIEVFGNLVKGDTIISKGNEEIREGMEVRNITLPGTN